MCSLVLHNATQVVIADHQHIHQRLFIYHSYKLRIHLNNQTQHHDY